MSKIQCPYCGYWQDPTPPIVLCINCYADLRAVIGHQFTQDSLDDRQEGFEDDYRKRTGTLPQQNLTETGRQLSGAGVLLKRTLEAATKRFCTLYPLIFISLFSFMWIGVFTARIGARIAFEEVRSADSTSIYLSVAGIVICLLTSLYGQAASIIAVANARYGIRDALSQAFRRLGSYAGLFVLMAAIVGTGFSLLLLPGAIAGVFLVFSPFIFAAEDVGVIASFAKSVEYVRRAWLPVFFRLGPVSLLVFLLTFLFAYGGVAILWATQDVLAFMCIIALLESAPIVFLAVYIFKLYEDVRTVQGIVPVSAGVPTRHPVAVAAETISAPAGLPPFEVLQRSAWRVYKTRFVPLSVLNLISYLPHVIHLGLLLAGYVALKTFFDAFGIKGDYGLLAFLVPPRGILGILIVGIVIYGLVYLLAAIVCIMLYLRLELAYVYAIADDTISAGGALRKAGKRLGPFFWVTLYRDFIVATHFMLFLPGVACAVWYRFTPYIFALENDEHTPLASLWKSRELVSGFWWTVFRQMISLTALPLKIAGLLVLFIYTGLPFYWISGVFLSFFAGLHLPGMLTIYSGFFWAIMALLFYVAVGLCFLPFQKVFLYILYRELKTLQGGVKTGTSHS